MHAIAGVPRSGSTLLCNVLNQNPAFYASSTSILPVMVMTLNQVWSQSTELKGDLGRDQEGTEDRLERTARAMCDAWHLDRRGKTVFDKSRGWNNLVMPFQRLFPSGKMIICLRDLRDVFASIEKQHRKQPLLDVMVRPEQQGLSQRAQLMFGPKGLVGSCLRGIKDIIDRRLDVYWLRYEDFAAYPEQTLQRVYAYLGIEQLYPHDYEDVYNTATDPDYLYLNKYPHSGSGKIEPRPSEWRKYMSPDLAKQIMDGFPWYNTVFGYGGKRLKPIRENVLTI